MLILLLAGCLLDKAGYLARLDELSDDDNDGFAQEDDCDDEDSSAFPDASETCDGVDDDCDGVIDEGAVDAPIWYEDADGDGFGDADTATPSCEAPASTWTNRSGDCDDTAAAVSPAGTEIPYDDVDQDCDGDDVVDVDGDGYPATAAGGSDCDDGDAGINPGAADVPYDDVDQDCSGADTIDVDGDGAAAATAGGDDCDDADGDVFPGATETWANGFTDNDCDGEPGAATLEYGGTEWVGEVGDGLGTGLTALGDIDSDGTADYLAGAPYEDSRFTAGGADYLLTGAGGGPVGDQPALVAGGEYWFIGGGMGPGPDLDGDGILDFVMSATGWSDGMGKTWVVSGGRLLTAGQTLPDDVAIGSVCGVTSGWYSGASTVFLGDIVGDGSESVAISAPLASSGGLPEAGLATVFNAAALGELTLADADITVAGYYDYANFGDSIEAAGDVDGDGIADYLVGFDLGDVAVIMPGGVSSPVLPDDAIFRLTGTDEVQGANAAMVGDVDGDGVNDIGCVVLDHSFRFFTSLAAHAVLTVEEESYEVDAGTGAWGTPPVSLGDLDDDGEAETLLPLMWLPEYTSAAAAIIAGADLRPGSQSFQSLPLMAVPAARSGGFGRHAILAGDVDGNGLPDLLLSASDDDAGGDGAGAVLAIPLPQ